MNSRESAVCVEMILQYSEGQMPSDRTLQYIVAKAGMMRSLQENGNVTTASPRIMDTICKIECRSESH